MRQYDVLIIDDEPWAREIVKMLGEWERLGLRVVGEADDGTSGLREIGRLSPHIVVTDMRMPGLEGVELLERIHRDFPHVKLLVMSGYDDYVYLRQAIRSRARDYLLKPLDPDQLNRALAVCAEELDREHGESANPAHPVLFKDGKTLEIYHTHRRAIAGWLAEMDAKETADAFVRLKTFLAEALERERQSDPEAFSLPAALRNVDRDLMAVLEPFAAEHGIDIDGLAGDWRNRAAPLTAEASADRLAAIFLNAIEEAARRRKSGKLDIAEVVRYLDSRFAEPLSLDAVAKHFLVSKEHISRAFKERTGMTVNEYILRKRMELAYQAVVEQKLPIRRAAELCGYDDLAYFYRVFKKHWGVPPGELRQDSE